MKAIVLKNYDYIFNDFIYGEGQIIEVTEEDKYNKDYAIYYSNTVDWIPKELVQILDKGENNDATD